MTPTLTRIVPRPPDFQEAATSLELGPSASPRAVGTERGTGDMPSPARLLDDSSSASPLNKKVRAKPAQQSVRPPCNTGVENTRIRASIDWQRWSKPKTEKHLAQQLVGRICKTFNTTGTAITSNHFGYDDGLDLALGFGSVTWRESRGQDLADGGPRNPKPVGKVETKEQKQDREELDIYRYRQFRNQPKGKVEVDILVDLPGQAMEYLREEMGFPDIMVGQMLEKLGFQPTRIDAAMDCYDTTVNPQMVYDHAEIKDSVVTHAKKLRIDQSDLKFGERRPTDGKCMTVYIGSRSCERYMRVYDKKGEKKAKTGKDDLPHCTRFEMECKGDAAKETWKILAENGTSTIPNLLSGFVDFLSVPRGKVDKNKSRRKRRTAWWARMVEGKRTILHLQRGTATPEKTLAWLKDGVGKSIALAKAAGVWQVVEADAAKKKETLLPSDIRKWEYALRDQVAGIQKWMMKNFECGESDETETGTVQKAAQDQEEAEVLTSQAAPDAAD